MKKTKDLSRNVRVNGGDLRSAESLGWSTQKLIDWAIGQVKSRRIKPKEKK